MAGGSKTEKATPKRRQDERKKGNIFLSKDVVIVASLLGAFFTLKTLSPFIYTTLKKFTLSYINFAGTKTEISQTFASEITFELVIAFFKVAMPIIMASILISIVATISQTKLLFSTDSLKPKFNRLNPIQGFKRMFSMKSFVEVIKGVIKITILFYIMYDFIEGRIIGFSRTISMDLSASCVVLFHSLMQLVIKISIAFIAISAFDYFYQWWDYEKQIKMSKQEIKEEYKQMEGDPQIKGKIKDTQRKMAMSRMMQAVPTADVIIRNPTHFAIALKYDIDKNEAPMLVAKGQDELALRIVKVAEENGVFVIENKPLARAIFATTDLNREIPMEFYGTVAEILVYVYQLRKKEI